MLRDSGKTSMSSSAKTAIQTEKPLPVMLCRLCHCEFTNFKEHVKSLVHLDAREGAGLKSTSTPAAKHKSSSEDHGESAKRIKTEEEEKSSSASEKNNHDDKLGESKDTQVTDSSKVQEPQSDQLYSPTTAYLDEESSNVSQEQDNPKTADVNGSLTAESDESQLILSAKDLKDFAKITNVKLSELQLSTIIKTWRCKLCSHMHHAAHETFEEHAKSQDHLTPMEKRLNSMKHAFRFRTSYRWLMNCLACAFFTNDNELFISHVKSEQHEKNIAKLIGTNTSPRWNKICTCFKAKAAKAAEAAKAAGNDQQNSNSTNQGNRAKTNWKASTPQESKGAVKSPLNKKGTPIKAVPVKAVPVKAVPVQKQTKFPKPFIEKSQVSMTAPKIAAPVKSYPTPMKSNPAPLMSLSLPDPVNKNPSRWQPLSPVNRTPATFPSLTRNQSNQSSQSNQSNVPRNPLPPNPPNNQPGLLGEYRPPGTQTEFAFKQDVPLGFLSQPVAPLSLGMGMGMGMGAGRPPMERPYPEDNRASFIGTRRSHQVESFGSVFGCDKYDHVWSGRNPASPEKLNCLAFGRAEPDPPMSEFDTLSKLFTQQPGLLPPNVSLDLASNSSIRFKFNSDRGSMFDNYPASRPDLSRNDFARHDLPRNNASRDDMSRSDLYSRSMFSRR